MLATLSAEADFPGTSFFLHERLGLGETPCFDLRAQCSGFVYSLSVANAFVRSGQYRRVLVIGCEVHSTGLDLTTEGRDVAVLFGDGAGAVVVEANDDAGRSRARSSRCGCTRRASTRTSSGSRRPARASSRRGSPTS